MRPRIALLAFVIATFVVHALVGYWSPISGDDWAHVVWAGQHRDAGVVGFLLAHATFSKVAGYVLARWMLVHAIATPLAVIAIVLGMFVIATGRLPRDAWDDVLGVVSLSTMLWIALPSAGLVWAHRTYAATYVYGAAVALWLLAAVRCRWRLGAAWWPALVVGGWLVGTSSRAIATATLIGVLVAMRGVRERWMRIAAIALALGTIAGYALPPWFEIPRVVRRGLEPNLKLMNLPVAEAGKLVAVVGALVLFDALRRTFASGGAPDDARPDPHATMRWGYTWLALVVWALFGPHYSAGTLLPATIAISFAAYPYFLWLARDRVLRRVLIGLAIGVHAIVWTIAVTSYARIGSEWHARLAALEHTPAGGVARVVPYSQVLPNDWFFGEDLGPAGSRQLIAIAAYGLRDIDLVPPIRRTEPNPHVEMKLEVDSVTDAQLAAAAPPPIWATEVSAARTQFQLLVDRLTRVVGHDVDARLVVTNVAFPDAHGRPLLAAWSEHGELVPKRESRTNPDANDRIVAKLYPPSDRLFTEAWWIADGRSRSIPYAGGQPRVQPLVVTLTAIAACNDKRCLLVDAFIPRF